MGGPKKERGFYATDGRKANFFMHFGRGEA